MVNKAMMATASLAGRLSIDLTSSGQRLNPSRKCACGWLCQPMSCKRLNHSSFDTAIGPMPPNPRAPIAIMTMLAIYNVAVT